MYSNCVLHYTAFSHVLNYYSAWSLMNMRKVVETPRTRKYEWPLTRMPLENPAKIALVKPIEWKNWVKMRTKLPERFFDLYDITQNLGAKLRQQKVSWIAEWYFFVTSFDQYKKCMLPNEYRVLKTMKDLFAL